MFNCISRAKGVIVKHSGVPCPVLTHSIRLQNSHQAEVSGEDQLLQQRGEAFDLHHLLSYLYSFSSLSPNAFGVKLYITY